VVINNKGSEYNRRRSDLHPIMVGGGHSNNLNNNVMNMPSNVINHEQNNGSPKFEKGYLRHKSVAARVNTNNNGANKRVAFDG